MSDFRSSDPRARGEASPSVPEEVRRDLDALHDATAREPMSLKHTLGALRRRGARPLEEGFGMSALRVLKARPWLATALAAAIVAVTVLGVPISYERVTGYDVTLAVSGPGLGQEGVAKMAHELKALLGAEGVTVRAEARGEGTSYALGARVPARSGRGAEAAARAYAAALERQGLTASATSSPRKEKVSGTVYAYAMDRVIEINMDGKSAAELEAEIKQRLADAGITDAQVSVNTSTEGDKQKLELKVEAKHSLEGSQAGSGEGVMPELVLKKGGEPVDGKGFTVRVAKKRSDAGTSLIVRVQEGDKSGEAQVANYEGMSDDALSTEIARQLQSAGLEVEVHVGGDGRIEVKPREAH